MLEVPQSSLVHLPCHSDFCLVAPWPSGLNLRSNGPRNSVNSCKLFQELTIAGFCQFLHVGANCFDVIVSVGKEANDPAVALHRNLERGSQLRSERPVCFARAGHERQRGHDTGYCSVPRTWMECPSNFHYELFRGKMNLQKGTCRKREQ
jgi:hypothetical protein